MKYYEACSSSNEMNWNIMKHAVAVMKWIEKHEMKYELKWNEMKWIEKHEMKHAVLVMKWIENMKWSMNWNEMKWIEINWKT